MEVLTKSRFSLIVLWKTRARFHFWVTFTWTSGLQEYTRLPSDYEPFQNDVTQLMSDEFFAQQRLAGANPMSLRVVSHHKENGEESTRTHAKAYKMDLQSRTKLLTHPPSPHSMFRSNFFRLPPVRRINIEPGGGGWEKKSFWDRLGVIRCVWLIMFRKMDKINPCVNTSCPGL